MVKKHLDEARNDAIEALQQILAEQPSIDKVVLIDDLFGRIRVVVWGPRDRTEEYDRSISERLREAAGPFWSGEIWHGNGESKADQLVYDREWEEGHPVQERFRRADRVRNRTGWFRPIGKPPWSAVSETPGPPIVVFYSFKGGVGRTTALASFAIQRARAGERVAVLDLDLDAPGVGTLLAADKSGMAASWGVVDYLLERQLGDLDLRDYYHACSRSAVTGSGAVLVLPAGSLDPERDYLGKLARLDLDPPFGEDGKQPLEFLLEHVRAELQPHWLLVDARAGLSEPAGVLLSGGAHLHVLFGTSSEQSWRGLRPVLERIGASRVRDDHPQLECVLVHAMVPENVDAAVAAKESFAERSLGEFRDHYYAPDPEDPDVDRLWYVRDSEASDAPHAPVPISYQPRLAHFSCIDDVAADLAESKEFCELADRIAQRFARGEE
ncbi:MAG: KGGVGR-motif variant AAA ATPase [Pseudomonadota bacterium]